MVCRRAKIQGLRAIFYSPSVVGRIRKVIEKKSQKEEVRGRVFGGDVTTIRRYPSARTEKEGLNEPFAHQGENLTRGSVGNRMEKNSERGELGKGVATECTMRLQNAGRRK